VEASLTAEVDLLRHALAAVWTELEKDLPDLKGVQRVVEQALRMTPSRRGKELTLGAMGVAGWDEYVVECIERRVRREGG
jgi:hypothetical protein